MRPPTERFSGRVGHYERHRPGYPEALLDLLAAEVGLGPGVRVADVGAGTGILTAMLLDRGATVVAVEPNPEMRAAADRRLGGRPGYTSVAGRAEATGLPAATVELVTAAQAFHWFDRAAFAREARRVLAPGGWVAVVWNEREVAASPFLEAYESLLQELAPEYRQVDHRRVTAEDIAACLGPGPARVYELANEQTLDLEGFEGRLLSSSYVPPPDHPDHGPLLERARRIFAEHQEGGRVRVLYTTRLHLGRGA